MCKACVATVAVRWRRNNFLRYLNYTTNASLAPHNTGIMWVFVYVFYLFKVRIAVSEPTTALLEALEAGRPRREHRNQLRKTWPANAAHTYLVKPSYTY